MAVKAQMNHSRNMKRKASRSEDKGKQILINPIEEIIDLEILHSKSKGTTKSNAISVEHYSNEIDLHLAIRASLGPPLPPLHHHQHLIDLSDSDDDAHNELKILQSKPKNTRFRKRRRISQGCSSNSTPLICEICTETQEREEFFSISGCSHAYCSMCISRYVGCRLEENRVKIGCPAAGCGGVLDPEGCRRILADEVFDKWGRALCEDVIPESEKFYCPYKDCSALFIDDGGEGMEETECPNCRRAFCVRCKVVWHAGIDCERFQRLREDERGHEDILLMNLAEEKRWTRCPHCGFFVEKISGCTNMTCRCGKSFFYTGNVHVVPQVANNDFFTGNLPMLRQVANNDWIGPFLKQFSLKKF